MTETVGKLMIYKALPEKYRRGLTSINEDVLSDIMTRIAREDPDKYSDLIQKLSDIGKEVANDYGRSASLKLDDFDMPSSLKAYKRLAQKAVKQIINNPNIPSDIKKQRIIKLMTKYVEEAPDKIQKAALDINNGMAVQIASGARGNKKQLMQLLFGDGLMVNAEDKPVPIPGIHGYGEGVNPLEYWASSIGARKGSASVQFSTADTGYLGKQLNNIGHRTIVTEEDCGTGQGFITEADDVDNIGSVLAQDIGTYKAGTIITPAVMKDLGDQKILVRSTMTCEAKDGVCAKCSGIREDNRLPDLGEVVGAVAARALAEPIMQSSLSSKHYGGTIGTGSSISGFEELNQFLQVPKVFRDKAILTNKDGLVESIEKAPAGGWYVEVNGEKHFVPQDRKLAVKKGDRLEQGDVLSDGVPNPAEIVEYKGIGEGRKYFMDQFQKLLKKNRAGVHRRNIEALARSFINRVEITDPDGFDGYIVGDIVPYDDLVKSYEPREKSYKTKPGVMTHNKFLEKPILHYSIGTRLTNKVIDNLKQNNISEILINDTPPPFQPVGVRARNMLETDPDWLVRMAGENLERSMMSAVRRGGTSKIHGTSYIPAIAYGVELGKGEKGKY